MLGLPGMLSPLAKTLASRGAAMTGGGDSSPSPQGHGISSLMVKFGQNNKGAGAPPSDNGMGMGAGMGQPPETGASLLPATPPWIRNLLGHTSPPSMPPPGMGMGQPPMAQPPMGGMPTGFGQMPPMPQPPSMGQPPMGLGELVGLRPQGGGSIIDAIKNMPPGGYPPSGPTMVRM